MSCCENPDFLFERVKIDTSAPTFDLPAYDPIRDDETRIDSKNLK